MITVNKLVRLGKREVSPDGIIKCLPLRFTVDLFDYKRHTLKAHSILRSCEYTIFSNIYFTPDLTKNQRRKAYELRLEKRTREKKGETNLKISKGKIVNVEKNESMKTADKGLFGGGTASGDGPSVSNV